MKNSFNKLIYKNDEYIFNTLGIDFFKPNLWIKTLL